MGDTLVASTSTSSSSSMDLIHMRYCTCHSLACQLRPQLAYGSPHLLYVLAFLRSRRGSRIQKGGGGGSYIQKGGGGFVHSKGGVSYRNFRSGSKLLQGPAPGQINKQNKLQTTVGGGGGPITPPKNLYPRLRGM